MCRHSGIPNISPLNEAHPLIMDKAEQARNFPIEDRAFSQQAYHVAGSSSECTLLRHKSPTGVPNLSQSCLER